VAEQKRLVSELRGRHEEAQQWNFKYKVYISDCHCIVVDKTIAKINVHVHVSV
jgi:hypothetical protein